MAARQLLTPEPAEHATYWNSAVDYHLTMKNAQWRPQSAPKATHPRSASPLAFWNKRGGTSGGHHQLRDDESDEAWPRMGTATSRDDGDHMLIDTVSNHLGRLTPPSPSSSMDSKSKDRDLRISTKKAPTINCEPKFGQGPPPIITKAEYDALPLAIQRKVRCKSVSLVVLRLARCPIPNCHFRSAFRHVDLTRNPGFIFASPAWKPFPPFERDWHFFPCIPVHPACFFVFFFSVLRVPHQCACLRFRRRASNGKPPKPLCLASTRSVVALSLPVEVVIGPVAPQRCPVSLRGSRVRFRQNGGLLSARRPSEPERLQCPGGNFTPRIMSDDPPRGR